MAGPTGGAAAVLDEQWQAWGRLRHSTPFSSWGRGHPNALSAFPHLGQAVTDGLSLQGQSVAQCPAWQLLESPVKPSLGVLEVYQWAALGLTRLPSSGHA